MHRILDLRSYVSIPISAGILLPRRIESIVRYAGNTRWLNVGLSIFPTSSRQPVLGSNRYMRGVMPIVVGFMQPCILSLHMSDMLGKEKDDALQAWCPLTQNCCPFHTRKHPSKLTGCKINLSDLVAQRSRVSLLWSGFRWQKRYVIGGVELAVHSCC